MFTPQRSTTMVGSAFATAELIYHNTVRSIRKGHENAFISLFNNIMQSLVLVGVFYVMFDGLGMRGSVIRGDFLLFIMSGVFLFMTHTKTMSSIVSSEGPASPMMNHLPMNTAIAIASAAMGALYVQTLSVIVILGVYAAGWGPISIAEPAGAFGMLLLAWFSGLAVGLVFLAMKPWAPGFVSLGSSIYARANMIASGKMFVANALPASMLALFDWNPLFHVIDQARGVTFITDQDARPAGSAHPQVHLWDNGADVAAELRRMMLVRRVALDRFGEAVIREGRPMAEMEEALVPLYQHHRYQAEAAAKIVGGLYYTYALRGDGQEPRRWVPAEAQEAALDALMRTLLPEELKIPEAVLQNLPPRPPGSDGSAELFRRWTGLVFDAVSPAAAAADGTLQFLLQDERAARLVQQHALDEDLPGFVDMLDLLWETLFDRATRVWFFLETADARQLAPHVGREVLLEGYQQGERTFQVVHYRVLTPEPAQNP